MAEETTSRKKKYEPTDDDYELTRIEICEAENGVVISCSYDLKDEIRDKMKNMERDSGLYHGYFGSDSEKHVFEDKTAAKKFISDELDRLWSENASEGNPY